MTEPALPLVLEVGRGLPVREIAVPAARGLRDDVRRLSRDLGLPGEPDVSVVASDAERALRIRLHGAVRPYSRRLLLRAWRAVAPPDLHHVATREAADGGRFPDGWVRLVARDHPELVARLAQRLAIETIKTRPGCLVGREQAGAYAPDWKAPQSLLDDALRRILDLGLSLGARPVILDALETSHRLGATVAEAVEAVFTALRSPVIQVQLPPAYVQSCDDELRANLALLEGTLGAELGVAWPRLRLLERSDLQDAELGVRMHDQESMLPILRRDELLVGVAPSRLARLGLAGRPLINPATRQDCTVVSGDLLPEVERLDLPYWQPAGFVVLAVYGEAWRLAHRLIGAEDVSRRMAQLESSMPVLLSRALASWSTADVVGVVRELVSEGMSPGDLTLILESMADFDTMQIAEDDLVVFDDRTPSGSSSDRAALLLRRVRTGMSAQIRERIFRNGQRPPLVGLGRGLEGRVRATLDGAPQSEREFLRDAIWAELVAAAPSDLGPVIVTSPDTRLAMRRLIEDEMPDTLVVSSEELQPDTIGMELQAPLR